MIIRREICEQIQRRLAGGTPSSDFEPTLSEINSWLDAAVAKCATISYNQSAQVEYEYVADSFYATYKNIALSKDNDSGYFKGALPQAVIGLVRGYDISEAMIMGTGQYSKPLVRVSPIQLSIYEDLPKPKDEIFYWTEGSDIYVRSSFSIAGKKLVVRMAGSAGKRGLDDELLCPADMIDLVINYVRTQFAQPIPQDRSADGLNQK
jgi:hypothetical protein